jgi:glycosyltransferase involved in cell wall biosynthesis
MRILLCSNFYYRRGGDCTYLLALQRLLERHGHETAVFSMRHPQNLPCAQEAYFVDFLDYVELNKARNPMNVAKVLGHSVWSSQARRNIARLLADWKPDVAHLQNIHAYLTPSILVPLQAAGVPVVWSLHDYKLICPNDNFFSNGRICEECRGGRFWRCALNRCKKGSRAASAMVALEALVHRALKVPGRVDRFIVPSEFVQRKFAEFGYDVGRFEVMPHFLDGSPAGAQGGGGYGLYAGTLMPFKGVGTLLRALAQAPPHPFHVLGGGALLEDYRRQARELGLDQVVFRGFLTGAELEAELAGAAYAVVPSEWWETFSYAAQEPLSRGIPVIASDLGALPELVRDGETGLLFPAGDAAALAERMARLWGDAGLRAELGSRARKFIQSRCDADAYLRRLVSLYEGLPPPASRKV